MVYDDEAKVAYGSFGNARTGATYFGTFNPATRGVRKLADYSDGLSFFGMGLTADGLLVAIDKTERFIMSVKPTARCRRLPTRVCRLLILHPAQ